MNNIVWEAHCKSFGEGRSKTKCDKISGDAQRRVKNSNVSKNVEDNGETVIGICSTGSQL